MTFLLGLISIWSCKKAKLLDFQGIIHHPSTSNVAKIVQFLAALKIVRRKAGNFHFSFLKTTCMEVLNISICILEIWEQSLEQLRGREVKTELWGIQIQPSVLHDE